MIYSKRDEGIKKAAIYSRKSKLTEHGESIDNQIQLCKEYGTKIGIKEFYIYEDEGYSGKNTHRPQFQQLISDAKAKKFNVLICYRLDRISRNISDFSNLIIDLQDLEIDFVSIREQFDTTTPMGRAMMYIASVFAQLERETIAERVRDNMLELAKTGRWLGGQTPFGYGSKAVTFVDDKMKQRKMFTLDPVDSELQIVRLIFDLYYSKNSISQVTKYLILNDIKTKNGALWTKKRIQLILRNPLYVKSNLKVLDYLKKQGIMTSGTADNFHGILTYNKSKGATKKRDSTEWIAAVSTHPGIIDPERWIDVQQMLDKNKEKRPRLGTSPSSIFSGILKCRFCGSNMVIKHGHISSETGSRIQYFVCSLKDVSYNTKCKNSNVRKDEVELEVINVLKEIPLEKESILKSIQCLHLPTGYDSSSIETEKKITKKIDANTEKIQNLIDILSKTPTLSEYITKHINLIETENCSLKKKLNELENTKISKNNNLDYISKHLSNIGSVIELLETNERHRLLYALIDKIYWNGTYGEIEIIFK
ncbi:MAG: recombinase family protein [Bacillota bacterium]|nr:recombinase family protein [Bacillota bacterium]